MLNKKAIFDALNKAPLCHGHLIKQAGLAIEYCAMGALAKGVGCSDDELREISRIDMGGTELWNRYGNQIYAKYGIETLNDFQRLMNANDAEAFSTRRNKKVAEVVEAFSPQQVDEIIADTPIEIETLADPEE